MIDLEVFNKETTPTRSTRGKATVRFNKAGQITISATAVRQLRLNDRPYVFFARDRQKPEDWYMKVSNDKLKGYPLRRSASKGAVCNSAVICHTILKQFKPGSDVKSISFPICIQPAFDDDDSFYALATKNPL